MIQNNITSSLLDKLQQKIMSFSFANQPIQQKNTNDHVTSASEESSYKEGQDIEKKRNSMKNVCYLDDSSDDYPGENNRANPSSESYEF